ncbi:MAG: hypothetical protein NZ898_07075 [Myxococcota bacterium]|nr:hypothetical protein [Myxococcota bacterium]MDW8362571.1 hypothetical protein [Myxococcales bacterium]
MGVPRDERGAGSRIWSAVVSVTAAVAAVGLAVWSWTRPMGESLARGEGADVEDTNGSARSARVRRPWIGDGSGRRDRAAASRLADGGIASSMDDTRASHDAWGTRSDGTEDPQVRAFHRSYASVVADAGAAPPFWPTTFGARIDVVEGDLPLRSDARCDLRVLPVRSGPYNCLIRVQCDGIVLYPDDALEAGYAPCDVIDGMAVTGGEDAFTHADGDPAVRFDLTRGRVHVREEAPGRPRYRVELRLEGRRFNPTG